MFQIKMFCQVITEGLMIGSNGEVLVVALHDPGDREELFGKLRGSGSLLSVASLLGVAVGPHWAAEVRNEGGRILLDLRQSSASSETVDGKLDESLARAIWGGSPLGNPFKIMSARQRQKQFDRMMSFQKKKTESNGWPVSGLMIKYGVRVGEEGVHAERSGGGSQEATCREIPTGRVRVILDAKRPEDYSEGFWTPEGIKPILWDEPGMWAGAQLDGIPMGESMWSIMKTRGEGNNVGNYGGIEMEEDVPDWSGEGGLGLRLPAESQKDSTEGNEQDGTEKSDHNELGMDGGEAVARSGRWMAAPLVEHMSFWGSPWLGLDGGMGTSEDDVFWD